MPDALIGQPIDRIDGRAKVTGRARYSADHIPRTSPLYGVIVTSTIGRGQITAIETDAARASPGVKLVMTHENAPSQAPFKQEGEDRHGRPKPQLADDQVHYHGEPVALVVAERLEQAQEAAHLIKVTYKPEPAAFDLEHARPSAYVPKSLNEMGPPETKEGDVERACAEAPVTVEATYTTPYQNHNPMELHASVAEWFGDKLTIHCAAQLVDSAHHSIAATLKMPLEKVEVISEFIGGGFGNKLPIYADAILAALAARQLGQPVKVVLTRQQMFAVVTHRAATIQRLRLAAR
jgi:xanthine dehydrogenase YagR molybdenum-binding subunit